MSTMAVFRLGNRLFWHDRAMLTASVATPLLLGVGLPVMMSRLGRPQDAVAMYHGMIALLLSVSGFMAIATLLTARRDHLVLKRMRATGLTDRQILTGEIGNVVWQQILLVALVTAGARLFAGVPLPRDPVLFAVFAVAGATVAAMLGAAWTAAIPRAELAAAMSVPFFLLAALGGGAFGPLLDLLPPWLGTALSLLPTSPVVDAVRTAYDEGGDLAGDLAAAGRPALLLAVWAAVAVVAMARWFRWEPRRP
ncbi:ABC-2 type transport system permease protein [Thermocatellispora tengchongensis]|uniref:ABC-2 type transport system permease protein n=1 Tax=Thermocatellispora tengchongensis TaxID=1073253 RepID=A0A840P9X0_9ACTN|nr:ABC transporter permease [Thermocatellispora tengchongensis]MBB5132795.1 ABC-2 type transport system permease protein [Thermocatellispora tengchongensis]